MLAGLVWALQKDLGGRDVLRWGVACGAAAASLDGTAVGSLTLVVSRNLCKGWGRIRLIGIC